MQVGTISHHDCEEESGISTGRPPGLYPGIRGLLMGMVVVTSDPNAPPGISTVTDPDVLKLD